MSEANIRLVLPQSLRLLVSNQFVQAQKTQSLIFSDTQLCVLQNKSGVPFQLRYCPALSKKPVDRKATSQLTQFQSTNPTAPKKRFDPFENPSAELLVARIPDPSDHTHNLILNKYPVIPNHFILATKGNEPQTNILKEADLHLSYVCTQLWDDGEQHDLYGFFNSGEQSGASQPHRHLQFLPVEDMRGPPSRSQWDLLCNQMTTPIHGTLPLHHHPGLPIIHLATPLSATMTPSQLHDKYLLLVRAVSVLLSNNKNMNPASVRETLTSSDLDTANIADETGRTTFSYNLAFTTNIMAILPRRAEDATIAGLVNGTRGTGTVSINGTILAGTLMVKNEDEWETLQAEPQMLDAMLMQIGFPWNSSDLSKI